MLLDFLFGNRKGSPMRTGTDTYRTRSGLHRFTFEFQERSDGNWRVYITSQPDYCGRDDDAYSTHRLTDGGRRYVCWTGELRTIRDAKQVAQTWAEKTERYVRFGTPFSQ